MIRILLLSTIVLLLSTSRLRPQASDSIQYNLVSGSAFAFFKKGGRPLVYVARNSFSAIFSAHKAFPVECMRFGIFYSSPFPKRVDNWEARKIKRSGGVYSFEALSRCEDTVDIVLSFTPCSVEDRATRRWNRQYYAIAPTDSNGEHRIAAYLQRLYRRYYFNHAANHWAFIQH